MSWTMVSQEVDGHEWALMGPGCVWAHLQKPSTVFIVFHILPNKSLTPPAIQKADALAKG